jgi:hypothetical protein
VSRWCLLLRGRKSKGGWGLDLQFTIYSDARPRATNTRSFLLVKSEVV